MARPTLAYFIFNINVLASDSETVGGVYIMKQDKMSNVFTTSTSLQVFSSEKSISFLADMKLSKDEKSNRVSCIECYVTASESFEF